MRDGEWVAPLLWGAQPQPRQHSTAGLCCWSLLAPARRWSLLAHARGRWRRRPLIWWLVASASVLCCTRLADAHTLASLAIMKLQNVDPLVRAAGSVHTRTLHAVCTAPPP